jgi:two-component system response regulator (stage 0 sporulation protein F)
METRPKVLIVDDEESSRFFYSEELRTEGYDPIQAKNGKEAIRMLKDIKPDVIVLEIVMPVMDGMETLGRIIGHHKDIPIILHSSYSHHRENFMRWAADAYVTKSSDSGELKETMRNLLEREEKKG